MIDSVKFIIIILLAKAFVFALIIYWLLHQIGKQTGELLKKIKNLQERLVGE